MYFTSEQLWEHLLGRLRTFLSQNWNFEAVTTVTGSTESTVSDWLAEIQPPVGVRLIKLWHFLAAAGLDSPELNEIPAFNRYLGELLMHGIITIDDVSQIANVKNQQSTVQILRGQVPANPSYSFTDVKELYGQQLAEKRTAFAKTYQLKSPVCDPVPKRTEPPTAKAPPAKPSAIDDVVVASALIRALLPYLEELVSEETSPATRDILRRQAPQEAIFNASNLLGALCSERAREGLR